MSNNDGRLKHETGGPVPADVSAAAAKLGARGGAVSGRANIERVNAGRTRLERAKAARKAGRARKRRSRRA